MFRLIPKLFFLVCATSYAQMPPSIEQLTLLNKQTQVDRPLTEEPVNVSTRGLDVTSLLVERVRKTQLLIVGEVHGSAEPPALVTEIALNWSKHHTGVVPQPVVVALEYPQTEAAALGAFIASTGDAKARQQLLATPFWSRANQDGRSSVAMFNLIESVRRARSEGLNVKVAAFDMNEVQITNEQDRDQAMAENLRGIVLANSAAKVIALTGNFHARKKVGAPWSPKHRFMAAYLLDLSPYSLRIDANRGANWGCVEVENNCKAREFELSEAKRMPVGVYRNAETDASGYDEALMLDSLALSTPAKGLLSEN